MYLDKIPELSFPRLVRARARGIPILDADRAAAIAWISDGAYLPSDTIVRFDITAGEDPGRRLADALGSTGARALWFFGGDEVARRAAGDLDLELVSGGAVFVHRMDPLARDRALALRPPSARDRMTLAEIHAEHAPGFRAPETLFAQVGTEIVGVAMSEALDGEWTEVRVFVYPAHRGRGHGAAIFIAAADRLEAAGRLVCAGTEAAEGRGRSALEQAGFRLVDYYFTARRGRR